MKCPKCAYLGFETGERCRNCGYDFSLLAGQPRRSRETAGGSPAGGAESSRAARMREVEAAAAHPQESERRRRPDQSGPTPVSRATGTKLPLFGAGAAAGDEPLVKLPSVPRPPLAVRRTPDAPRFRTVPKPNRPAAPEAALAFEDEAQPPRGSPAQRALLDDTAPASTAPPVPNAVEAGGPVPRLWAAVLDHAILGSIDAAVVYLTLRLAGLTSDDWMLLPKAPLLGFLILVKMCYFAAFTAVGGQTIGKMAARIRVVALDGTPVDASASLRRALAAGVSAAALGLGFALALFDAERRSLHDRVARTRVIGASAA